jgi:hypothetical protein
LLGSFMAYMSDDMGAKAVGDVRRAGANGGWRFTRRRVRPGRVSPA